MTPSTELEAFDEAQRQWRSGTIHWVSPIIMFLETSMPGRAFSWVSASVKEWINREYISQAIELLSILDSIDKSFISQQLDAWQEQSDALYFSNNDPVYTVLANLHAAAGFYSEGNHVKYRTRLFNSLLLLNSSYHLDEKQLPLPLVKFAEMNCIS
jgi:hypothetical protein